MANISSTIQLYDRVSAPINNMLGAINNIIYAFDSVESSMDGAFDSSSINEARNQMQQATAQMIALGNEIEDNERSQERFNADIDNGTSKIMQMVKAYASMQGVKKVLDLSDEYTRTTARLNMIVDSQNDVETLQNKIFASAQRTRYAYTSMADMVAKLSMRTGKMFKNDEAILFAENLNKLYKIAGATQEEMKSSQLQLMQAMGSGVLRGEEFNAVFEAAPNIMQAVADTMDVPIGKLREMAADGKISADIVKNALLNIPQETLDAFNDIPMAWSDVWTNTMNELYMTSLPILKVINWLAQNWSILEPIVVGLATAVGLYTAALLINKGIQMASAIARAIDTIAIVAHGEATAAEMAATNGMTEAQLAFNAALYASPLTWIVLAIIAVIAIIYVVIAIINKCKGTTISAIGVIVGALAVAGAFILNLAIGLYNALIQLLWTIFVEPFLGIIEWILNACNGGFDSFGGAVANLIGNIISWFLSLGQVVTRIIDAIFGTNWTGGLESLKGKVIAWGKTENAVTLNREAPLMASRVEYGSAYNSGYNWGAGIGDSLSSGLEDLLGDNAGEALAQTAENTGKSADALDITNEDLKYLRDIAERDVVNRFTTAEIKVEMTNNNNINGDMDLDGVVEYLVVGVNEAMEKAAEGVHV